MNGRFVAAAINSAGKKGEEKGQMRLLRSRGLAELRTIVSGSATHGLWLRDREVGSQIIGEDRSRLPERETVGEVREVEKKPTTK